MRDFRISLNDLRIVKVAKNLGEFCEGDYDLGEYKMPPRAEEILTQDFNHSIAEIAFVNEDASKFVLVRDFENKLVRSTEEVLYKNMIPMNIEGVHFVYAVPKTVAGGKIVRSANISFSMPSESFANGIMFSELVKINNDFVSRQLQEFLADRDRGNERVQAEAELSVSRPEYMAMFE